MANSYAAAQAAEIARKRKQASLTFTNPPTVRVPNRQSPLGRAVFGSFRRGQNTARLPTWLNNNPPSFIPSAPSVAHAVNATLDAPGNLWGKLVVPPPPEDWTRPPVPAPAPQTSVRGRKGGY